MKALSIVLDKKCKTILCIISNIYAVSRYKGGKIT